MNDLTIREINERIRKTNEDIEKTTSEYRKRDLERHIKRLVRERKKIYDRALEEICENVRRLVMQRRKAK